MKFSHILCVLPLTLAAATPLAKRDGDEVNNDITGIDLAVRRLTATVNDYQGGILEAEPVFAASLAVHAINRKGFADANDSERFTQEESEDIVNNTMESVGESIPASVDALIAKKPEFDDAELRTVVLSTINLLKYDHETFSAAVGKKLTLDQTAGGLAAAGKIDAVLQKAALAYAVPG